MFFFVCLFSTTFSLKKHFQIFSINFNDLWQFFNLFVCLFEFEYFLIGSIECHWKLMEKFVFRFLLEFYRDSAGISTETPLKMLLNSRVPKKEFFIRNG